MCHSKIVRFNIAVRKAFFLISDPGNVRLADGDGPWEGRVEFFHEGRWGSVCDDGWDHDNTKVVCRQLGYSAGRIATVHPALEDTPIWLDEVACRGDELSLDDCQHNEYGDTNCHHFEDVGLVCGKALRWRHMNVM